MKPLQVHISQFTQRNSSAYGMDQDGPSSCKAEWDGYPATRYQSECNCPPLPTFYQYVVRTVICQCLFFWVGGIFAFGLYGLSDTSTEMFGFNMYPGVPLLQGRNSCNIFLLTRR